MKRRLFYWEMGGFLFTAAAGTLLHFVYEWSGGNALAAAFSAANESVWEHLKLLFFPAFLFSLVQVCREGRNYPNFPAVRGLSVLTGLVLIPVLYYTYTGALGVHILWVDMAIFYLSDLALFWLDWRLLGQGRFSSGWQQILGFVVIWGLAFCFVWCTFHPPALPLWQDPTTGLFGVPFPGVGG